MISSYKKIDAKQSFSTTATEYTAKQPKRLTTILSELYFAVPRQVGQIIYYLYLPAGYAVHPMAKTTRISEKTAFIFSKIFFQKKKSVKDYFFLLLFLFQWWLFRKLKLASGF
jgi:hypothetical protein